MDTKPLQGEREGMGQAAVPPDANMHDLPGLVRHEVDIDVFSQGHVGYLDDVLVQ